MSLDARSIPSAFDPIKTSFITSSSHSLSPPGAMVLGVHAILLSTSATRMRNMVNVSNVKMVRIHFAFLHGRPRPTIVFIFTTFKHIYYFGHIYFSMQTFRNEVIFMILNAIATVAFGRRIWSESREFHDANPMECSNCIHLSFCSEKHFRTEQKTKLKLKDFFLGLHKDAKNKIN